MAKTRTTVAISMGDPSGIGAEVLAAALAARGMKRALRPVVFGDDGVFARACKLMGVADTLPRVELGEAIPAAGGLVRVSRLAAADRKPGKPSHAGALAQAAYLEAAIIAVQTGAADALCTAPIRKAALHAAGLDFPGHTELLAARFGVPRVVMMLAGPVLRVVVATTHVALADVPARLTPEGIAENLVITHRALREQFGIKRPKIAVCGLNPHAGEGGLFGDEEARIIAPGIALAAKAGVKAEGPYPADGLFPRAARGGWDAVLAMYHDQGLIPLKTVHRETAVNVTLGLPIVRTSPDHGVAFDIAGKGVADRTSMIEALRLAARAGSSTAP
ncbi:4-hydroxythreonine-4-phosphate dehydrogenase PdxA [Vulgatibacter incomptus]|uniref:4-hydroxythreonine-4-phosphate dehydrogenase n=1 Tax=Vulgatibacter incomptus TaxID=1391653 RepID=A0A0K1PHE0_9BACT|nr:4-hydroxythreonine-4-phosphate dehydrogenase PdxA [Vulgatibacter incomptus]AKU92927.1 4-hydroxythreonine-4-phosphate dehydrogenase [Vulgatibacter incomptus]